MIQGQELELALGLPVEITSFSDNMPRVCYPFKLKDLKRANIYLSNFNHNNLEECIGNQSSLIALTYFLSESFRDIELEELLNFIDIECFPEIINDIKIVSGIKDSKGEIDLNSSSKDAIGWQRSINAIQTYTSNNFEDIQNMTLTQYNSLLSYVGLVINWEYKTNVISSIEKPKDFIKDDEHPLSAERKIEHKNRMTMNDIKNFKNSK